MEYQIPEARQNIQTWKAHLLRSMNQDAARHEILENLMQSPFFYYGLGNEVFAKKIPRKSKRLVWEAWNSLAYQCSYEKQCQLNEIEMLTFVHSFESCTQNSLAVLAIIDDVFTQPKEVMPEINSVYLRQDNAGCYHCASTLLLVHRVATKHGINLKRVDFSDSQRGKGSGDRKAATIKSHENICQCWP